MMAPLSKICASKSPHVLATLMGGFLYRLARAL
jgi:hypothetical protein